jgi:histidinol-phosphate aminotransferase
MVLAYAGPGDQVLYSQHGFLVYRIAAQIAGATPIAAPETGLKTDCAALLEAVTPATKIVLLANPNNPTGSYLTYEELKELRLRLPEHVLLGIDAAYAEYAVGAPSYEDGHRLAHEHDNVVMLRTFSKIYGLAGLRVGWAFGSPPVVEILNRIRGPFNVGAGAQAAACAALSDTAHIARARAHNDIYLPWLRTRVLECGLRADPSFGNFLLVQFPKSPELNADSAAAFLKERRILVRKMGAYDLPHCLRITIAEQECVEAAAEALADFVKQAATQ